jgi:hypothetical protein
LKQYLEKDKFGEVFFERFGHETFLLYNLFNHILALKYTVSFISGLEETSINSEDGDIVKEEYEFAEKYLNKFQKYLSSGDFIKLKYLSKKEFQLLNQIVDNLSKKHTIEDLNQTIDNFINESWANKLEIDFNVHIANMLINNLDECKKGKNSWQEYEKITYSIIQFLFSPQFEYIYKQARTEDGHQVRDIILPNYQENGFFKSIKDEFQSYNIVIEAKNGTSKALNKNSLNQLRVYLSKKSIGRFGILLIRNESNKSLITAQKLAYSDDKIMILILNDIKLKKMIYSKVLLGSPEYYLYKLKTDFDLSF